MDFWDLHEQHYSQVRKFIVSLVRDEWVADDLTQETFTRLHEHLGTLRDPSKASSWIFGVAHNLCVDHFRKVRTSPTPDAENWSQEDIDDEPGVQKQMERRQMSDCVRAQIDLLPESLRTVILLMDIMNFSQQEAAEILGTTVGNVKVRLHRARKKLKDLLDVRCTFQVDEGSVLICQPKEDVEG
ncbi:MAG: RNA polymerase sigma factor [Desulfomonile tiedjei]|nr:RNA polymerase sigma factor [Desulfomonile tiedjei]